MEKKWEYYTKRKEILYHKKETIKRVDAKEFNR